MKIIEIGVIRALSVALTINVMLFVGYAFHNSSDAAPKKGGILKISILNDMCGFDSLKVPITGRQL
jgi:hypothetical protein